MTDLTAQSRSAAHALLETQLAETQRVGRLLDAQYAVLTRAGMDGETVLLDEVRDALTGLDRCRGRLAPLLDTLRRERLEGPGARSVRARLRDVEAEARRAHAAAERLGLVLQRLSAGAAEEIGELGEALRSPGGQGAYGRRGAVPAAALDTMG